MSILLNRISEYKNNKFNDLREHYAGLASSQAPHTLLVTCSDSRLSPQEFGVAQSGELFIVRNAGNLIPAPNLGSPSNEALTIEYGICALGIKELVVCGHKSCGAMAGLMNTEGLSSVPLVQKGLENYKACHEEEVGSCGDLDSLISWNVTQQLKTLMTYDFIKDRVLKGELKLVGMVYDFVNADVTYNVEVNTKGEIS